MAKSLLTSKAIGGLGSRRMQLSTNPTAYESNGTLAMPSGYNTPYEKDDKENSRNPSVFSMGGGKQVPTALKEEDYVVDFEGPDDPRNPQNWSTWKKYNQDPCPSVSTAADEYALEATRRA